MTALSLDRLLGALHDVPRNDLAALRFAGRYEPAAGPEAKVFPPGYPTDARQALTGPYLIEKRYVDGEAVDTVLLDSVASQANRIEDALLDAVTYERISLPLLIVSDTIHGRKIELTSLAMPHRCSDAYLQDSEEADGEKRRFDQTELGRQLRLAQLRDATVVYRHCPTALVFGTWDSHRGKPERSFRVPRSYSSELFGVSPLPGLRVGHRLDPLGMLGGRVIVEPGGPENPRWQLATTQEETAEGGTDDRPVDALPRGERQDKLSNVGHGNSPLPFVATGGVAVTSIHRRAALSLAGLRRLRFPIDGKGDADRDASGRAVLAALALLGDRLAFGAPADLSLRSGCDLVLMDEQIDAIHRGGEEEEIEASAEQCIDLLSQARAAATSLGLPWVDEPQRFRPTAYLKRALEANLITV